MSSGLERVWQRLVTSRRLPTASLSAASVLGSPVISRSFLPFTDQLGVGLSAMVIYQSVTDSGILGVQLSWVLLGYLVYAYIPDFYPKSLSFVGRSRTLRGLSSALTVFIGLVISVTSGTMDPGVAWGIIPAPSTTTDAEAAVALFEIIMPGIFAWMVLFSLAIWIQIDATVTDPSHPVLMSLDQYSIEDRVEDEIETLIALPQPARGIMIVLLSVVNTVIVIGPCLLMGIGSAMMNTFYPLPEILLLLGIVGTTAARTLDRDIDIEKFDIETDILDILTDINRNSKGLILTLYCCFGILISGSFFGIGLLYLLPTAEMATEVPDLVNSVLEDHSLNRMEKFTLAASISAVLWVLLNLVTAMLLYGIYGLFYWYRQLRRLPPYVRYWERYWKVEYPSRPTGTPTRPKGLFLPGTALLLPFSILSALPPTRFSRHHGMDIRGALSQSSGWGVLSLSTTHSRQSEMPSTPIRVR